MANSAAQAEEASRAAAELPAVRVDPEQLVQVLTNLVDNAVKFTEQGHVKVDVTGEEEAEQPEVAALDEELLDKTP